jgi:hypothetical protein
LKKADTGLRPCLWLVYDHERGDELEFMGAAPTDSATVRTVRVLADGLAVQVMVQMAGLTV